MVTKSYKEFAYRVNEVAANRNALNNDPIYNGIQNIRFNKLDDLTSQFEYCEIMIAMTDCYKHQSFKHNLKLKISR